MPVDWLNWPYLLQLSMIFFGHNWTNYNPSSNNLIKCEKTLCSISNKSKKKGSNQIIVHHPNMMILLVTRNYTCCMVLIYVPSPTKRKTMLQQLPVNSPNKHNQIKASGN